MRGFLRFQAWPRQARLSLAPLVRIRDPAFSGRQPIKTLNVEYACNNSTGFCVWFTMKVRQQLRQHSVAFISIAGVELLLALGDLERVVFFSRYDKGDARQSTEGWAYVLTVRDMASLTTEPTINASVVLLDTRVACGLF